MKKKVLSLILLILVVLTMSSCKNNDATMKSSESGENNQTESSDENLLSGKYKAQIKLKDKKGSIELELDADAAPITVTNFVNLVNEKFYDGLTFHRIINGFMIQGGDPNGNGSGGSEKTIKGEFASNGVKNSISHKRGVISMARSSDKNSASSQFFIMHKDNSGLDGEYAAFGHVTKGMDLVDELATKTKVQDGNGTVKKEDQPVIKSIRMVDDDEKKAK